MSKLERITFNNGATFWEYDSPERLAEIVALVNSEEAEKPFSPQRMVEATLKVERAMYG